MTAPASSVTQRRVARALRAGGPEVIDVCLEEVAPLQAGEALIRVEAAGLNHAETLIRSDNYVVRLPFPFALGGEGAGVVVATGPEARMPVGSRVCWAGILGSCATLLTAPERMLAPIPDALSFEDGACLAVAGLTAGGLARVWPTKGRSAVVWGAAGSVGRMLVALLADQGADVIGIASGKRVDDVRAAGARHVIDRTSEDVPESVPNYTSGLGAAAVFDPIGAATHAISPQLLAPRGCWVTYGELSGPAPAINLHQLFPRSLFVSKYNGRHWVEAHEMASLITAALNLATKRPAVISNVAGRFPLDRAADAYRALESDCRGKVLVLPHRE
ncbi:MAG: zinc-binding dehydrogenase [Terriglobales bacterium]